MWQCNQLSKHRPKTMLYFPSTVYCLKERPLNLKLTLSKDGSVVKSLVILLEVSFDSQQPHDRSQPSVSLVLGKLMPSSGLQGPLHSLHTCTSKQTRTHTVYNFSQGTKLVLIKVEWVLNPKLGSSVKTSGWTKHENSRSEVTNLVRQSGPAVMVRTELVWV